MGLVFDFGLILVFVLDFGFGFRVMFGFLVRVCVSMLGLSWFWISDLNNEFWVLGLV